MLICCTFLLTDRLKSLMGMWMMEVQVTETNPFSEAFDKICKQSTPFLELCVSQAFSTSIQFYLDIGLFLYKLIGLMSKSQEETDQHALRYSVHFLEKSESVEFGSY